MLLNNNNKKIPKEAKITNLANSFFFLFSLNKNKKFITIKKYKKVFKNGSRGKIKFRNSAKNDISIVPKKEMIV